MSTVLLGLCWPIQIDPTAKTVLVSLADQASDDGECYPAVGTIAGRTCLSERTVQTALRRLRDLGLLTMRQQASGKRTNAYTLHPEAWQGPRMLSNAQKRAAAAAQKLADSQAGVPVDGALFGPENGPAQTPGTPQELHPAGDAPRRSCTRSGAGAAPESSMNLKPNTPIPPAGQGAGGPSSKPKRKLRSGAVPLAEWLEACKAEGVKPIPADDPVHEYARTVGISSEMLLLAWREFKRVRLASRKGQADWRATFRNAVRGNWFRVWVIRGGGGDAALSTVGEQLRRELEAEQQAAQGGLAGGEA